MTAMDQMRRILFFDQKTQKGLVEAGLYHYFREADETYTRFHLRVENDASGMLLVNATAAARLSPSGVVIAKGLLDLESDEEIYQRLSSIFSSAGPDEMKQDLGRVREIIDNLSAPGDNYPIINLEDADLSPYSAELIAPLRADIPLVEYQLTRKIIDKLWEAAIPHITIRTWDNFNIENLVLAVERAEDIGIIAGVRAQSQKLSRGNNIRELANTGVDYLTIPIASSSPVIHDSLVENDDFVSFEPVITEIRMNEVAVVAEIPLVNQTVEELGSTLDYLAKLGVTNIQFYAIAAPDDMDEKEAAGAVRSSGMPLVANLVEELANEMDVRFIWQPPVLREGAISISEQITRGPRCSDDFSVRISSSGEVVPPRGPYESAGNLLHQDWNEIWNHRAFRNYRERVERPTRCDDCPDLAICAADCPRKIKGWSEGYELIKE